MAGIIDVINNIDTIQAVSNANQKISAHDIYSGVSGIVAGAGSGVNSGLAGGAGGVGPGSAHVALPGFGSAAFDPLIYAYSDLLTYSITQNPQYFVANHHRLIAEELMRVERGETKRLIITMPPRHGKPVAISELIQMVSGERKPLGELVQGDFVISNTGKPRKVLHIFEQGELDCVKIKMFSGRETIAAYDHPYFTTEGYVEAINLNGHICAIPENMQCIDTANETIDEFKLTAYLLADGSLTQQTVRFTKGDNAVLDDFIKISSSMGFYNRTKESKNKKYSDVFLNIKGTNWCKEKNIHGKRSIHKTIPDFIFKGSKEKIRAFIGAYFSCDGSVNQKGKTRNDCCIEIYSSSKTMLERIMHLCARVGIEVIVRHKKAKIKKQDNTYKSFDSWRLSISNSDNAYIFKNSIPIIGEKKEKLSLWNVRKTRFSSGYLYDKVVSVEKCGKHKCRCLEVEEDHTFLVNDVIVHNSQLASEYFQAWYMGRNPDKQLIFVTYSGDKAVDVGRSVRNQLVDPVFQEIFHSCRISEDAKAAASFTTSKGGKFYALGIGGGLTGRGANLLIIDDPIKSREDAESQLKRDRIVDFFGSVAYTRLMTDDNAIILIMTRWHYDDLVGYALQELQHEGWKILDLPAIAEKQEDFVFDNGDTWYRNEGDPLWPEYYSLERLKSVKQTLKARDWSSLYQQSPQPDEGAMVNIEWFNGVDGKRRFDIKQLPRFESIYFSCDTAFKEKESNDPSAILVFGEYQNSFYLIHVTNERLAYPKLKQECKDLFQKYRHFAHNGCRAFIVEDKASGQSLIQDLRVDKDFVMPLIAINPENNKILRMDECTGHLEAGIIKLPKRAPWLTDLELQLSRFPYDKHDDMCDALSQFIKWKFKVGKLKKRVRRKRYWK